MADYSDRSIGLDLIYENRMKFSLGDVTAKNIRASRSAPARASGRENESYGKQNSRVIVNLKMALLQRMEVTRSLSILVKAVFRPSGPEERWFSEFFESAKEEVGRPPYYIKSLGGGVIFHNQEARFFAFDSITFQLIDLYIIPNF